MSSRGQFKAPRRRSFSRELHARDPTDSGRDAREVAFLVPADLTLASTSSTLIAARRAPVAHDVFNDFKKLLIGGWEG